MARLVLPTQPHGLSHDGDGGEEREEQEVVQPIAAQVPDPLRPVGRARGEVQDEYDADADGDGELQEVEQHRVGPVRAEEGGLRHLHTMSTAIS